MRETDNCRYIAFRLFVLIIYVLLKYKFLHLFIFSIDSIINFSLIEIYYQSYENLFQINYIDFLVVVVLLNFMVFENRFLFNSRVISSIGSSIPDIA